MTTNEQDTTADRDDECRERQEAELEFVSSAYTAQEAWWEQDEATTIITVHRKLHLPCNDNSFLSPEGLESSSSLLWIHLQLTLSKKYPVHEKLVVDGTVDGAARGQRQNKNASSMLLLRKTALDALPSLLKTCNEIGDEYVGEESIFPVLNAAEDWVKNEWHELLMKALKMSSSSRTQHDNSKMWEGNGNSDSTETVVTLGRRLIYSHHIISKKKRADIKGLASTYKLTGYMKVGWPGLIVIEGLECDCQQFYDDIRPWKWQYLVVRGEQQEEVIVRYSPGHESSSSTGSMIDGRRKFSTFDEVDDISLVANACRDAGLEALFKTSMKQYSVDEDNEGDDGDGELREIFGGTVDNGHAMYGVLVLVDHMNDGKGYRKWLRSTSGDTNTFLVTRQFFQDGDYTKRPTILVGIVGTQANTSNFMKRWRTSRVDVDSRGRSCLERKMKVLIEGHIQKTCYEVTGLCNWDDASSDEKFSTTQDQLINLLLAIGGERWADQVI